MGEDAHPTTAFNRPPESAHDAKGSVQGVTYTSVRKEMTVFVATSKRFYEEAMRIVERLKNCNVTVFHPYFHLDVNEVDADPELKSKITGQHFPEIEKSEILYALLPGGYIGCSVTIELTYAYAKGKSIVVSELPDEFAVRSIVSEICRPEEFLARFERK
jgi:hypothetical protein